MVDWLLAVDPGLNNPAAALFYDKHLLAASRIKPDKASRELDIAERCRQVANCVVAWVKTFDPPPAMTVVVEWPQVYSAGKSKGDPNHLLPLAGMAMCIAGRFDAAVKSYRPAEWIGQCRKAETGDPLASPRGQLVWRMLSVTERARVTLSHDAIDAVGIGLFHLGRLRLHVYPGAT